MIGFALFNINVVFIMLTHTVKITSKGQITLPREVRDFLHTDIITFELMDSSVLIKPVVTVAGSLKSYDKDISFDKARGIAWGGVADDYQA